MGLIIIIWSKNKKCKKTVRFAFTVVFTTFLW